MNTIKRLGVITLVIIGIALGNGCASMWQVTVSLTDTVESASTEYAKLYNRGLITADVHKKVSEAHVKYRQSAGVAADALKAYKASGDTDVTAYQQAFAFAQAAAASFVDIIIPFLTKDEAQTLSNNIKRANKL